MYCSVKKCITSLKDISGYSESYSLLMNVFVSGTTSVSGDNSIGSIRISFDGLFRSHEYASSMQCLTNDVMKSH